MFKPGESFELKVNSTTIKIREVEIPGYRAFQAMFSSKREPITVVRTTDRNGNKFWTTIPENEARQMEAEGLGKLIQEHIAKHEEEK